MAECQFKKRIQFYLDDWTSGPALKDLEEHLKSCPQCQVEMAALVEINSGAQEIIDQAPDRSYWDSFVCRVRNRIIARDVEPAPVEINTPRYPVYRLGLVLVVMVLLIGAVFVVMRHPFQNTRPMPIPPPPIVQYPAPPGFFPPPGFADYRPGNPPLNTFKEPSQSGQVTDIDRAAPKPGDVNKGGYAELKFKDPASQFKTFSLVERTDLYPSNEYALIPPSLTEISGSSDPAFRLKSEFVGQRILAGLGMNAANPSAVFYQGSLYGYSATSFSGNEPEASFKWGYSRNPSDTSKSGEIKKYLIELEIMQSK